LFRILRRRAMPKEISALARRNKLPGSGTLAGPAGGSFTMLAVWNSETGSSAEPFTT